ncbi:MAG: glycosyltransferase family 4 protein, partial [Oligoflexales bacterium]|nr:glycosyltransferase family 4 protein [Oligoflexales bacterium]
DKAYLVTTAHDEPSFHIKRIFSPLFASAKGLIFLAEKEKELVNRIYEIPPGVKQITGGYGVPDPVPLSADDELKLNKKYKKLLELPYFLFVGRACVTKRCYELIEAYKRATDEYGMKTRLVFAGFLDMELDAGRKDIVSVGFVSEQEKAFLMKHARALVNPSATESLSMVLLESWINDTLVIANGECEVMKELCDKSGGGVYYHSRAMFRGLLKWAYENEEASRRLGKTGHEFVKKEFVWEKVRKRYLEAVT